jgi:RNA polymerase sigma-70 factor (ECF subfamily)
MATPHLRTAYAGSEVPARTLEYASVFREQYRFVGALAARLCGRASEVEDIVQDVFLHCALKFETIVDDASVRPWLRTVTVRVVRKRLRRKKWRSWFSTDDTNLSELPSDRLLPDDLAALGALYRVLDLLPVNERTAWSMRYIERATVADISTACDASLSSIKRRIEAANRRLVAAGYDPE